MEILVSRLIKLNDKFGQDIFLNKLRVFKELSLYLSKEKRKKDILEVGLDRNLYFRSLFATNYEELEFKRYQLVDKFTRENGLTQEEARQAVDCWHRVLTHNGVYNMTISEPAGEKEELFRLTLAAILNYKSGNYTGAISAFAALTPRNFPEARYYLGLCYLKGRGTTVNERTAIDHFEKGAAKGNTNCLYMLGKCSHEGLGYPPNISKAAEYYKEAMANGHREAQYQLGLLYFNGFEETKPNIVKAIDCFIRASKQGHIQAAEHLADIYFDNAEKRGSSYKQAIEWYEILAEKNVPDAYFRLGEIYTEGRGAAVDDKKGRSYYAKAANLGHEKALKLLRTALFQSQFANQMGIKENELPEDLMEKLRKMVGTESAKEKLLRDSRNNDAAAQYNLGVCYLAGLGFDRHLNKALTLLINAEAGGIEDARPVCGLTYYYIGKDYIDGDNKNYSRALDNFYSAEAYAKDMVEATVADLYYLIGSLNLRGIGGVVRDVALAESYFQKANGVDGSKALYELALCAKDIKEEKKAMVFFVKYLALGEELGGEKENIIGRFVRDYIKDGNELTEEEKQVLERAGFVS